MDKQTYKSASRAISSLKAHLVLVTKYRKGVINQQILEELVQIVQSLAGKWGVDILEVNGEADHFHILFEYYPQMQLSKFVNNLKTVTSRLINKNRLILRRFIHSAKLRYSVGLWQLQRTQQRINNSFYIVDTFYNEALSSSSGCWHSISSKGNRTPSLVKI